MTAGDRRRDAQRLGHEPDAHHARIINGANRVMPDERSVIFARLVIAAFMIVSKNPRMPYTISGTIAYCAQVLIQPVNRLEVNPNSAIEMKNGAMPRSTNSATLPISTSVIPTLTKTTASRISTSPRIARPTTEKPEPEDATTFAAASALARSVDSDELTLASAEEQFVPPAPVQTAVAIPGLVANVGDGRKGAMAESG